MTVVISEEIIIVKGFSFIHEARDMYIPKRQL